VSAGLFLLLLIFVGVLVVSVPAVVGYTKNSSRTELREAKKKLAIAARKERIADRALRSIKNDAGNPALEATIALDEIFALDNTDYKELN